MKLSILDQSPIVNGVTALDALESTVTLAQVAEKLGYTRYWVAEHHGMDKLASSVPEVLLTYLGMKTSKIRIGSGATLLPHYKPYKVAEIFNMLGTLFPDRIDLGIGRAPGGSAEASIALSGNFLANVKQTPELIEELLHFIYDDFPSDHMFANTKALPQPKTPPIPWILGTSPKSGELAANTSTGYCFGRFMSEHSGENIIENYKQHFIPNEYMHKPYAIVTISVICADTEEIAQRLVTEYLITRINPKKDKKQNLSSDELTMFNQYKNNMLYGTAMSVSEQIKDIFNSSPLDEIMIVTITNDYDSRQYSYELLAKSLL
ncbi:LLM class flavin-dependent oxidoreductase [Aquibacillus kalidii]|uniref:LLM class flavin-dependent oxidoreductase n=1 Tax=Aquibacillus kalidii TaxID=2762597 RepID=UPI0016491317|nr:LLM class flavin-dependent oxidoreductase [Aquibacillus kalidii]